MQPWLLPFLAFLSLTAARTLITLPSGVTNFLDMWGWHTGRYLVFYSVSYVLVTVVIFVGNLFGDRRAEIVSVLRRGIYPALVGAIILDALTLYLMHKTAELVDMYGN